MTNLETRYLNQPIEEFLTQGGDIREYANLVFTGQIFGNDDPTDVELGIHTADDLATALEALVETATVSTLDPHTTGTITDRDGEEIEIVKFDFHSEDEREWETLADEALEASDWTRTGPWRNNAAPVARRK